MKSIKLRLPWPPTVNTYWRKNGRGIHISKRGLQYQQDVYYLCQKYRKSFNETDRLYLKIEAFPPDKRKRDLDNLTKSLLDSLQKALVFCDDEQIDHLEIIRMTQKLNCVILTLISI